MTLLAANGQALWYLTRGSGTVALLLLTASVLFGVMNSTRWKTDRWPRFLTYGLHRNVTLLAIVFTVIHVVTTIADSFAPVGWIDALIPFLSPYRPVWLGLGTVAFDLLLALTITSFLRRRIGQKAWRLVHWLAYASWPVAMLHSLGTGSDARTGWLAAMGVISGLLVFGAVLWRVLVARDAEPAIRAGATLAGIGVLIGLLAWARGGPLEKGWAARAGTPASILNRWRTNPVAPAGPSVVATGPVRSLPPGRFDSTLAGSLKEIPAGAGLVTILIDAQAHGTFKGRVHVALRGQAIDGGGVAMVDSVVGLLPTGGQAWASGHVTGLDGRRVLATVQKPDGSTTHVLFVFRIDPSSDTVTGSLQGGVS
ncbi:MAG TPA: ferric reductase-like transmembrane domain-containing protein [Gaiellaceae bacterium]|nr:ferric reductase-like transmembrane domain-containing protein [Gaiellaceae bacterium]